MLSHLSCKNAFDKFGSRPKLWNDTFPWFLVAYVFYYNCQLRIRSSKYLRNRVSAAKIGDPITESLQLIFPKILKKSDSLNQDRGKARTYSCYFISHDKTTKKMTIETLLSVRTKFDLTGTCARRIPVWWWVLDKIIAFLEMCSSIWSCQTRLSFDAWFTEKKTQPFSFVVSLDMPTNQNKYLLSYYCKL